MIGIITGSGFYGFDSGEKKFVETKYGNVEVTLLELEGKKIAHISRHGEGHKTLSTSVNHRANISALKELGCELIIATTVCGINHADIKLTKIIVFEDLFFPDGRLPDGSYCTFYQEPGDKERGHYIYDSIFSKELISKIKEIKKDEWYFGKTYCYVNGPRFNTKQEIKFYAQYGDAVSQTAGPEAVLSGEAEIPYILIGYGTDYANGVLPEPTPIEELMENFAKSKETLMNAIKDILKLDVPKYDGFVLRFEKSE